MKRLNKVEYYYEKIIEIDKMIAEIGELIAKIHNVNIIHGDLTTSNILI